MLKQILYSRFFHGFFYFFSAVPSTLQSPRQEIAQQNKTIYRITSPTGKLYRLHFYIRLNDQRNSNSCFVKRLYFAMVCPFCLQLLQRFVLIARKKSNLHYTRRITLRRGVAHLRGLAQVNTALRKLRSPLATLRPIGLSRTRTPDLLHN